MRIYNRAIDAALDAWFQDKEWKMQWREVDNNRLAMKRAFLALIETQPSLLKPRTYRKGFRDGYNEGVVAGWNEKVRENIKQHVRYHGLWSQNEANDKYFPQLITDKDIV